MPRERTLAERVAALERRLGNLGATDGSPKSGLGEPPVDEFPNTTGQRDTPRTTARDGIPDSTGQQDPATSTALEPVPDASGRTDVDPAHPECTEDLGVRLDRLESTVAELQAGLQAVRGYVGNVHHVNESVERRANAAISAVERLESAPKTPPAMARVERTDSGSAADRPDERQDEDRDRGDDGVLDRLQSMV